MGLEEGDSPHLPWWSCVREETTRMLERGVRSRELRKPRPLFSVEEQGKGWRRGLVQEQALRRERKGLRGLEKLRSGRGIAQDQIRY